MFYLRFFLINISKNCTCANTYDARMECQVLLLSSRRNCQMVEVSNVSCCQIDDLSNPNGGWRNCKQKEVSNGGSVK